MKKSFINFTRSKLLEETNKEIIIKKNNPNESLINSKNLRDFINQYDILVVTVGTSNYRSSPKKSVKGVASLTSDKKQINLCESKNNFQVFKSFDTKLSNSFYEIKVLRKMQVCDKKLFTAIKNNQAKECLEKIFDDNGDKNNKREKAIKGFNYLNKLVGKFIKKEDYKFINYNSNLSLDNSNSRDSTIQNNFPLWDLHSKPCVRNISYENNKHDLSGSELDLYSKSSIITGSSHTITPMSNLMTEEDNKNEDDDFSLRDDANISFITYLDNYQSYKELNFPSDTS